MSGTDVYVGGGFSDAGGVTDTNGVARWDGSGWRAFGAGLDLAVMAIAVTEDDVYAGGYFQEAGGDPHADYVARWGKVAVSRQLYVPLVLRSE